MHHQPKRADATKFQSQPAPKIGLSLPFPVRGPCSPLLLRRTRLSVALKAKPHRPVQSKRGETKDAADAFGSALLVFGSLCSCFAWLGSNGFASPKPRQSASKRAALSHCGIVSPSARPSRCGVAGLAKPTGRAAMHGAHTTLCRATARLAAKAWRSHPTRRSPCFHTTAPRPSVASLFRHGSASFTHSNIFASPLEAKRWISVDLHAVHCSTAKC